MASLILWFKDESMMEYFDLTGGSRIQLKNSSIRLLLSNEYDDILVELSNLISITVCEICCGHLADMIEGFLQDNEYKYVKSKMGSQLIFRLISDF